MGQKELEECRVRLDEAAHAIDELADLLSDATELRVRETPAIERLNEILAMLVDVLK